MEFVGHDAPAPATVVRLSPEGVWFSRSASTDYRFQMRTQVFLRAGDERIGPLQGRIVQLGLRGRAPLLGLRFAPLSLPLAQQFLGVLNQLVAEGRAKPAVTGLPLKEEILRQDRIIALLTTLAGSEEWGTVVGVDGARAKISEVVQEGLVHWSYDGELPAGPALIEISGYNSVYRMYLDGLRAVAGGFLSALPSRVERIRHRWFRRGRVSEKWTVEFLHPLWNVPVVRRELRDVSFGGIAFTCDLEEDLVFPGLRLPLLKITGPSGQSVQLNGQVRFIRPAIGDRPAVCGMSVKPSFPEDEDAWTQFVLRTLNANTDSGPEWTEKMWELFNTSGYFNLSGKTPHEFDELKRSFCVVAEKTSSESRLSCQAVWPSERGVEASCSVVKAYEGTWMLHQVAKRRGGGFKPGGQVAHVLREIYLRSFEHAQADPDFRWAISYVEASVPWMQRSHIAFAAQHEASDMAMALPFRLMEAVCSERGEIGNVRYDISPMSAGERIILLSSIAQSKPVPYIESLDLVPSRFQMGETERRWGDAALDRRRITLVAREGTRAVAAAVLETGDIGTNLFRLLDGVRLFPLASDGHEAFPALLDAARTWYADRGRASFIYFWEDLHREEHTRMARLRDLGEGCFWAVSADLLPEFLEFVFERTARRPVQAVPAGRVVAERW
ncbi:Hypothetical protein A7982_08507 [Minicystis rosea]|nr:Hypothetical protein A7982_08507 [Minicystis rosea]